MVHQHFKLVHNFTVLENIVLGAEETKFGLLKLADARRRVQELCDKYKFDLDLDAKIEDITVGMQQRTEILKMLFRNNEIMIFDEPTAVLTPQEIQEFMIIVKNLKAEGKSKEQLGREKFLEEAWDWTHEYGGIIQSQQRKLGCSCDWERKIN